MSRSRRKESSCGRHHYAEGLKKWKKATRKSPKKATGRGAPGKPDRYAHRKPEIAMRDVIDNMVLDLSTP